MARDYVAIGSAPVNEDCVPVDPRVDYLPAMRAECGRFLELIRKKLGPEPPGARLGIKSNPHEFGSYLDVVCYFDDEDEEARKYAYRCEAEAPKTWGDGSPVQSVEPLKRVRQVCGSCLQVAYDDYGADGSSADWLMQEMGAEVEDHLCDGGDCVCACNVRRQRRSATSVA